MIPSSEDEGAVEEIETALKEPAAPEPKPVKVKRGKKVAKVVKKVKKGGKKVEAVKAKTSKPAKAKDGQVNIAQLAEEAGITPQRARQKLREAELERDGRWSWDEGSKALKGARKALGLEG